MNEGGQDAEGKEHYANPQQLWEKATSGAGADANWYSKAVSYWDAQEASYDGVLGGFGHVSDTDISDSAALLKRAFKAQLEVASGSGRRLVAVDCGAGVGRVTEQLLLHHFAEVDLLEPSQHLLDSAKKTLRAAVASGAFPRGHAPGRFLCMGLEKFEPEAGRYDCVWIQWCLLYLTDADAVALFERCNAGLTTDGIIVVKENICKQGFIVDKEDSSLTRSNTYMLELFEKAGMTVTYNIKQRNFPKELFDVRMYVLRPAKAAVAAAGTGSQQA